MPLFPAAPVEVIPPQINELRHVSTIATPDQFKALNFAIDLVPAQGPGSIIFPLFAIVSFIGNGVGYSAGRDILFLYDGEPQQVIGASINAIPVTGTSFINFRDTNSPLSWSPPVQEPRNKKVILLGFPAAAIAGGHADDRLFITMWYTVAYGHAI